VVTLLALAMATVTAPAGQTNRAEMASRIVGTIHPPDLVLKAQLEGWRKLQQKLILRDQVAARLEEKCPNILDISIAAAEPIASNELGKMLAAGAAKETEVLENGMTLPELDAVYAFVSSDTGQRYFRGTYTLREIPDAVVSIADRVRRADQTSFSKDEIAAADKMAEENGIRQLDDAGQHALQKFRASEAGKKFAQLQPAMNAANLQSFSRVDAGLRQREAAAMQTAMLNYIHAYCGKTQ
jgi:hypothetical protein